MCIRDRHEAAIMTGTIANPSSPSVKFTEFEEPTTTKIENGIKKYPKLMKVSFRNGIANPLKISGGEVSIIDIIAGIVINICKDNFIFPFRPEEEFLDILIQSSIIPIEPKPTIISNTVQTN